MCEEVYLNLAYRWFCRLESDVHDHSTFSNNRLTLTFQPSDAVQAVIPRVLSDVLTRKQQPDSFLVNMKHQPRSGLPSELQAHLGYWLRMVSNAVSRSFARKVETEGVTVAEWVFMRTLYDEEGISPSVLAERMGMTRGAISKLADRLVDKDLLERRADGGRGQLLSLRPAARELVLRLAELADQNDEEFFCTLSGTERACLDDVLRKLARARSLVAPPTD